MAEIYKSSEVADRIRLLAKAKNISVSTMFSEIGLGKNTLMNFKTSMPKADNIAKIADYLDVSVDYLLGRTDNPNTINGITTGDVKGINVKGDTSVKINTTVSKDTAELMEMLQDLTLVERSKVVIMIDEMKNKQP